MAIGSVNFGNGYFGTAAAGSYVNVKEGTARKNQNIFAGKTGNEITPEQREKLLEEINKIIEKNGKIDPLKDKVYIDPKTGERTTWKPGLRPLEPKDYPKNPGLIPDKEITDKKRAEARKRAAAVGAALLTAVLAFLFRGKIKGGVSKAVETLKPYFETATKKCGELFQNGFKTLEGVVDKAAKAVTPTVVKIKDAVVKNAGKVKTFAADLFNNIVKPNLTKVKNYAAGLFKTTGKAAV